MAFIMGWIVLPPKKKVEVLIYTMNATLFQNSVFTGEYIRIKS